MSDSTMPFQVTGSRFNKETNLTENFVDNINARNSLEAYKRTTNKAGYSQVTVTDIKIECPTCAGFHLTIPDHLYKE